MKFLDTAQNIIHMVCPGEYVYFNMYIHRFQCYMVDWTMIVIRHALQKQSELELGSMVPDSEVELGTCRSVKDGSFRSDVEMTSQLK